MTSTDRKTSSISIIIPTRNEAATIAATLTRAQHPAVKEILVVDGGSTDNTRELAGQLGARVLRSAPGRARQMNLGATLAQGEILLFLHGDTLLPVEFATQIPALLRAPGVIAGAFRLAIDQPGAGVRLVEKGANIRSTLMQMPYGDQGLFLHRQKFLAVGGYPDQPILEDLLLVKRLKRLGRIAISPSAVLTSGRRWQRLGVVRTTLINQAILVGHLAGVPPHYLFDWYRIGQQI
jgi:rSAM/selenodomain-associated transferase 2